MTATAGGPGSIDIAGGRPLRGVLVAPGDKSISHRALLVAARAEGASVIRGLSGGDDVRRTVASLSELGACFAGNHEVELRVTGGAGKLREAANVLDVGNSGTGIRLLAGYVAPFGWLTVITGDESIRRRPMDRVIQPLREMGARIDGRAGGALAPLVVRGGMLKGIDYTMPVASAQVKAAVILAGLGAAGVTTVREDVATRQHTEEILRLAGADLEVETPAGGAGRVVRVRESELSPFELGVPADPSQVAFFAVAACIVPGSEIHCKRVYVGPGRAGFLAVLARMGARIEVRHLDEVTADIVASYGPLHATEVAGHEVPGLIDEVPVLAVAAALAEGTTTFRDVGELRVKESDRIATVSGLLSALGARIESGPDWLTVEGVPGGLAGGRVRAAGDHRIAMSAAVGALACSSPVRIEGWDAVATSYPDFVRHLAELQQS